MHKWTLPMSTNLVHVRGVRVWISFGWVQQLSGPVWCVSSPVYTSMVCFISSSHHSSTRWTISLLFSPWERELQEANPNRPCEPNPFCPAPPPKTFTAIWQWSRTLEDESYRWLNIFHSFPAPSTAQYGITGSACDLFSCWSLVLTLSSVISISYLKNAVLQWI